MLQRVLEKPLEKKAGRNYGPPGNKKLIYFIDDMNMAAVSLTFFIANFSDVFGPTFRTFVGRAFWCNFN